MKTVKFLILATVLALLTMGVSECNPDPCRGDPSCEAATERATANAVFLATAAVTPTPEPTPAPTEIPLPMGEDVIFGPGCPEQPSSLVSKPGCPFGVSPTFPPGVTSP